MYTEDINSKNHTTKHRKSKNDKYVLFAIIIIIILLLILLYSKYSKDENSISNLVFQLKEGDITIQYNEDYVEPGYECHNGSTDLNSMVEVINNVIYGKPGQYSIIYKCQNQVLIRKVRVQGPNSYELTINYNIDNTNYTNQTIQVSYNISGETFANVVLPDGTKSSESSGSINISSNGVYIIKAYNIQNEEFAKEISINNIDLEKPTGTCSAIINNNNTEINVNASDNIGIIKYEYYDNNKLLINSDKSNYITSSSTSNNIKVKLYDEAGNNNDIICNIVDKKYHDPITPPANEKLVFKEETETLKAYITNVNNYYLTRIWVKDAHSQFNKAASPQYGKNLYNQTQLIQNAIQSNHLENKLVIGFNASAFYLKGVYDAYSVNQYPAYDRTEVGTIVINNGSLYRNAYDHAVKQWYITGINKENKMVIFEDNVAKTESEINDKKIWSNTVINSGIRNTFNFAGPVILNGKRVTDFSHSMPDYANSTPKGLQLICQINENNFVIFTSSKAKRTTAIDKFMELGCQTATNLDGGGSVYLLYKAKNSSNLTKVVGSNRAMPEAAYFTE